GVHRQRVVERAPGEDGDLAAVAAVDHAEFARAGDFLGEAHAARADDAARAPVLDVGTHGGLRLADFLLGEATVVAAVLHAVVLQLALAGLVALGAVERVVDEQELHHALAGLDLGRALR